MRCTLGYLLSIQLLLSVGCVANKEKAPTRPNIIYILTDQWRDTAVEGGGVKLPNITQLESEGLTFSNCVSVNPVCTPYRASLMTGRYPTSTGMFLNDIYLPSEELCFAEIFKSAGYNTAYIGKWHLDGHGRRDYIPRERRQGWDYWKAAECDHNNYKSHYYTGDSDAKLFWEDYDVFAQTKDAQQYITEHSKDDTPFVLMLSYGPPHPASPPAPKKYLDLYPLDKITLPPNVPDKFKEEAKQRLQNYYALETLIDEAVGSLLSTIDDEGIAENTIVIFTSDHGGMIYSHGLPAALKHAHWNESSHVPFIMRYPAIHGKDKHVVQIPITTPDILPTLLGLSNIEIPHSIEGEDISSLLENGNEQKDKVALFMSVAPSGSGSDRIQAYRAIRSSKYTYVRLLDGSNLLFDHVNDPFETKNLITNADYKGLSEQLDQKLQEQLNTITDDFLRPEDYIKQWGFKVGKANAIPYRGKTELQSPKKVSKEHGLP